MKIIELTNIGKKFPLAVGDSSFKKGNADIFQSRKNLNQIWALKNINIEIYKAEIVGIIGRNGAGKSTLLKILGGIIFPSEGESRVQGKVCGLFTLGAGFQNELSGRENIYLNSGILGMSNDSINKKYQEIVDFSELGDFINMPLGSYSDGMRMRLGFSVAIHAEFDILLIDEVLLVGDVSFQEKCFKILSDYKQQGKTMILTTQDLGLIGHLCNRVFLLEEGKIIFSGAPQEATDRYRKLLNEKEFFRRKHKKFVHTTKRWAEDMKDWGKKEITGSGIIKSVQILDGWGRRINRFKARDKMRIRISFDVDRRLEDVHFGIALFREDGVYCYGPNTRWDGHRIDLFPGKGWVSFEYENLLLAPGIYYLSIGIWEKDEKFAYDYYKGYYKIEIEGNNINSGLLCLPFKIKVSCGQVFLCRHNNYNSVDIKELQHKEDGMKAAEKARISKVEFLDRRNKEKKDFITGEELSIKVNFELNNEKIPQKDLRLWIGVFRSDGIYCHGVSQMINHESNETVLIYPQLRLLPGEYRVSAGLWNAQTQEFVAYHHKIYSFRVMFTKQDHGTVYLSHKWRWELSTNFKKSEE